LRLGAKKFRTFWVVNLGVFLTLLSCGKEPLQRNPYLVDLRFQREINLSLPLYNGLNFVGNSLLLPDLGINGVIVFNLNGSSFLAWEATCPNHIPKTCSSLSITGVLAECSCENFQYSLATGQLLNPSEDLDPPQGLLFYQVQNLNGTLRITN
jgi:nitrite reductase/ring-hydroxylating ferredoxin subunit